MAFTVNDFSFDILSHERVLADGGVRERFTIDAFHLGQPLDWHPNQQGAEDFPGIPNRQVFEWVGREVLPVHDAAGNPVGTKRGADFRTRFWPSIVHHAEKVLAAQAGGKRLGEVADAEVQKRAFTEPVDLKARSLDEAVESLTGRAVVPRDR